MSGAIFALAASCANRGSPGTAWGDGSFDTNGERIYFTGTTDSGSDIDYDGGPGSGAMMMGGRLTCATCHGTDARGGTHRMHMETMEAPNIRWIALVGEDEHTDEDDADGDDHSRSYGFEAFRAAGERKQQGSRPRLPPWSGPRRVPRRTKSPQAPLPLYGDGRPPP